MSDDKKLLPEFLPTPPTPGAPAAASPKERVNERARLLLDRFRGLRAAAGAAILSMQCYSSVDPLPPPPAQCATIPNPFDQPLSAWASFGPSVNGAIPSAEIMLSWFGETGVGIAAVRVTGGTLVSIEDKTSGPDGYSAFLITVTPDGNSGSFTFEVDFTCAAGMATKRFQVSFTNFQPNSPITVQEI